MKFKNLRFHNTLKVVVTFVGNAGKMSNYAMFVKSILWRNRNELPINMSSGNLSLKIATIGQSLVFLTSLR